MNEFDIIKNINEYGNNDDGLDNQKLSKDNSYNENNQTFKEDNGRKKYE